MMTAVAVVLLGSCTDKKECRIHGTVGIEQLNGKRIFLVPLYGPQTAEYVDSVEVKDGKFEFTTDTVMIAKLLMDYHYRMGVEQLLVVTEPGDLEVVIDSVSSGRGTPQNDSLQSWKELTQRHNRELSVVNRDARMLAAHGDTAEAARVSTRARTLHQTYKDETRRRAATMQGTLVGDFLKGLYPLTYQKKMPDGSIVTMNADTHEPVK